MGDPIGARHELSERIKAKLVQRGASGSDVDRWAAAVMELVHAVEDEWDRLDVTPMSYAGEQWIDQRYLVVRIPAAGVHISRPLNRTVDP